MERAATQEEIKNAFLKIAGEYHAAGKPANIDAVERFRRIARAYHVLIDADQRRRYDRLGENGIIDRPIPTGYDNLDALEQRVNSDRHRWPYCDPPLAEFLDLLFDGIL